MRQLQEHDPLTSQVEQALRAAEAGHQLDGWQEQAIEAAIDRMADAALGPGGGGLLQAVAVSKATTGLAGLTPEWARALDRAEGRKVENPFGKFAGLRISKKTYDRQRAYRFKKSYAKWVPFLLAWDGTLRLVATEARVRRTFRPGFVLDDNVVGEAVERPGGRRYVFIHPDWMAQVVKAHRERPLAVAAFLHGVAVHELTHVDGKMGDGHDEEFIARREDLGAATAHLLPAISVLVAKLLKIGERESDEAKRAARLERQVAELPEGAKEAKRALVGITRERDRLAAAASAPVVAPIVVAGSRAERLLEVAVGALWAAPPPGIEPAYVEGFVARNRGTLLGIVRGAFGQG